jgi:tryptophanyl-tRNA synthetase
MSKSYDNTIPLFCSRDELRKLINLITTDLRTPGEPKDPHSSTLFQLYSCFADAGEIAGMRRQFLEGIAWGEAKKQLFEFLDAKLSAPRSRYNALMNDLGHVEQELHKGAEKARAKAAPLLEKVRIAAGIRPLTYQAPAVVSDARKQEKSAEELVELAARADEGRRRAILVQLRPLLDRVAGADDKPAAAAAIIAQKAAEVDSLKKKAKQKAQNELDVLNEELAVFLNA